MSPRKKKEAKKEKFERREIPIQELEAILDRAKPALSAPDHEALKAAVDTLTTLTSELATRGASVRNLRKMLFGPSTEKMSWLFPAHHKQGQAEPTVVADPTNGTVAPDASAEPAVAAQEGTPSEPPKPKRKGHGRIAASEYEGAEKVKVPHASLTRGCCCPDCNAGSKLRQLHDPSVIVRVTGMAPIQAVVYEIERLRGNICGKVFTST